jgi:hypothetical protein
MVNFSQDFDMDPSAFPHKISEVMLHVLSATMGNAAKAERENFRGLYGPF